MAFKFSNLSLPSKDADRDLDPDTAIIDDELDDRGGAPAHGNSDAGDFRETRPTALADDGEHDAADRAAAGHGDDDEGASPLAGLAPGAGMLGAAAGGRRTRSFRTPLLSRLPLRKQVNLLLGVIAAALLIALGSAAFDDRNGRMAELQTQAVGDALMHSQRLAKAAGIAVQGSTLAYDQLQDSLQFLTAASAALAGGGKLGADQIAAVAAAVQPQVARLQRVWSDTAPAVNDVIGQQKVLLRFGELAYQSRIAADELTQQTVRAAEAVKRAGGNTPELLLLAQMELHLRTIAGEIVRLKQASDIKADDGALLARHIEGYALTRSAAQDGSAALGLGPLRNGEARTLLQQVAGKADAFIRSALEAQQALPALEQARVAGKKVFASSERLTDAIHEVRAGLTAVRARTGTGQWLAIGFGGVALLGLLLLGKAYYDDSSEKAAEAEAQRGEAERLEQDAKRLNDQNQAAILRLMNELQEVADGDLTVQATVSEDITGAIADSVNYTVEELRSLVGRINRTAAAVAEASAQAQITSTSLQAASDQQSREIRETGEAVLGMAAQIKQVSESAAESAEVARQSLSAAGRGREAVQNAITGMNGIRDQIQETAKRIKRLGESSQEIGEIIELISDITEQTNVLALNAAIQAASAGEAGRGFTVVAEEVQRLAERSAEATRQISALVKAIQTDTHDAVAAMERSTQGVVQGAKLSDEAGTALAGIGQVSKELAELIMRISRTTENQAESAELVAQSIQRILLVTEQTSEGTQQTAGSILQLSELARELKNSVSRFRVG
ncbi:MAG: methyl-accepting chemotaxis protein [Lautropia sp.]